MDTLFDLPKYFNTFSLQPIGKTICKRSTLSSDLVFDNGNDPYLGTYLISTDKSNPVLDLKVEFHPEVSDLNGAKPPIYFGESSWMEVKLNGLLDNNNPYAGQLLGWHTLNDTSNSTKG